MTDILAAIGGLVIILLAVMGGCVVWMALAAFVD